jgi:hypothetical protein
MIVGEKMDKRKTLWAVIIAVCVVVFTVSAVLLVIHFFPVKNDIIVYRIEGD